MINSKDNIEQKKPETGCVAKDEIESYKRLASIGKVSVDIINELYSPIDTINRFINLALHTVGEDSQSRQFLLESKEGIRKTSVLLKRLDSYAKEIEKEISEIIAKNGQSPSSHSN
ncbi:MAG: hypothetical protein WC515_00900 [Candidatus Omnitrophota bacterium]